MLPVWPLIHRKKENTQLPKQNQRYRGINNSSLVMHMLCFMKKGPPHSNNLLFTASSKLCENDGVFLFCVCFSVNPVFLLSLFHNLRPESPQSNIINLEEEGNLFSLAYKDNYARGVDWVSSALTCCRLTCLGIIPNTRS